jgi:hypothetical protein
MLANELIMSSPLRHLPDNGLLGAGSFGAVLARAGTGKTALMVQIALRTMLGRQNVLHLSLIDPVPKVSLWYQQVFDHLTANLDRSKVQDIWETILGHRLIMTFRVEGFSVPKLEERMNDLILQNVFTPRLVILDGLPFEDARPVLTELKALAARHPLAIWFSVTTHRHEQPDAATGMPVQISGLEDFFELILCLDPAGKQIQVQTLKGPGQRPALFLDPTTMLLAEAH